MNGSGRISTPMNARRGFLRDNALSLVLAVLFLGSLVGQYAAGISVLNRERADHGAPPVSWVDYATEPHFLTATFENWESEFLQMGIYVLLSACLRQRGSAESRALPGEEPPERVDPGPTPWPVARGGLWRTLYGHSLATALFALCVLSFVAHWRTSWLHEVQERLLADEPAPGFIAYLGDARFWFESLQNWQSEFVSVLAIVLLSIVLRQKDSPQSKPVVAPHRQTGT